MAEVNGGWVCFFNEEHQLPYYYNATTGESLWEPPEGFVDPAAEGHLNEMNPSVSSPVDDAPLTLTCLHDEEYYLFDPSLCFLDEMHRMGFMSTPADEEVIFVLQGHIAPELKKKLEALDMVLQTAGSDEEWAAVFQADGMALLRYLTCFLAPGVHIELAEVGARCLAYGGNIYPALWSDYCGGDEGGVGARVVVDVVKNATTRLASIVSAANAASSRRGSQTHGTYAGFDIRDVKEFGMTGMQEVVDAYHASRGEASFSAEQTQTSLLILLMVICKCLEAKSAWIGQEVVYARENNLTDMSPGELSDKDREAMDLVSSLLGTTRLLYNLLQIVEEDVYLSCIKAIAFINYQFPPRATGGSCSTEVAELCCQIKFDEASADHGAANLAEGLLHFVNDIGYPSHDVPEAIPVLFLCTALTWVPEYHGYFYTNDVKVLAEVIIRELANMPHMEGANVFSFAGSTEDLTFKTREMYVRLAGALVDNTGWSTTGDKHKYDEVRTVLEDCLRDQLPDYTRLEFEEICSKFY